MVRAFDFLLGMIDDKRRAHVRKGISTRAAILDVAVGRGVERWSGGACIGISADRLDMSKVVCFAFRFAR